MSKYSIPDAPPSRQDPWQEPRHDSRENASRGGQPAFEPTTAGVGPGPGAAEVPDRSLGEIIRDTRNLTHEQIEKILAHQKARGVRFGEAAVALGYVNADDVVQALAQQFNYPYAGAEKREYSDELVTLNAPFSRQAEAFRGLRSQIVMRTEQDGQIRNAIAVISPNHGDGRSYIAANLAVALAQLGGRTLLVDADLRNSRQHSLFGLTRSTGLSRILLGRKGESVIEGIKGVPNLYVLPAGAPPPNPLELLERPAFALLARELATKFDHVIIDTPAAEDGSDAAVVAVRCGSALMVARNQHSRLDALQRLAGNLNGISTQIVGVVTNDH